MKPQYLDWLHLEKIVTTREGKQIKVFELIIQDDEDILNSWAKHLREHYCADDEIDVLRSGYGLGRKEYLEKIKFPDAQVAPGPSVRAGDFSEILVADYVQYVLKYLVPRTRYDRKVNRNSSTMGCDLIGYKYGKANSKNDELIIFEVKAKASDVSPSAENELQKAINHSQKDVVRLAETLNAIVQRLLDRNDFEEAKRVQRFQNSTDNPYRKKYAAAAVHSNISYSETALKDVSTINHPDPDLILILQIPDRSFHIKS